MALIAVTLEDLYELVYPKMKDRPERYNFITSLSPSDLHDCFPEEDADYYVWWRFFHGKKRKPCQDVKGYLIHSTGGDGNHASYETCGVREALQEKWQKLLNKRHLATLEFHDVLLDRIELWRKIASDPAQTREIADFINFYQRLEILEQSTPTAGILACITLIALTLPTWPKELQKLSDDDMRLFDILLPPLPNSTDYTDYVEELEIGIQLLRQKKPYALGHLTAASKSTDSAVAGNAYYNLYLFWESRGNKASAESSLDNAKKLGHPDAIAMLDKQTEKDLQVAINAYKKNKGDWEKGKSLMDSCFAALAKSGKPETRALAAWTIYELFSEPWALPTGSNGNPLSLPAGETPDAFLKLAHDLGCEKSRDAWAKLDAAKKAGITHSCGATVDLEHSGIYRVTGPNELVSLIRKTAPKTWHECGQLPSGDITAKQTKYLFLSDDQEENLSNALEVMETLRQQVPTQDFFRNMIYVRGNSEELQTLVDTAANHMGKSMVPVSVLDDDKWAAQDLLFHHPLFFPVRSLASDRRATLHFVIIGSSRIAQWLLREAFCVMGLRKKENAQEIACEITVLSPDADTVKSSVEYYCPGLADGATSKDLVPHSKIIYQTIPAYDSPEFDAAVRTILRSDCCYPYFAVCAGNDTENLRIATKIRELQIRDVIAPIHASEVSLPALSDLPPIAFHCRNDNIAHLSRQLVAYNETYGDQWFNNWSLIPFGTRSERYAWDKLDGLLDQLAWAFHRQYAGAETTEKEQKAQSDYYAWGYNQDSSRGAAVSLPYRLFQFHCKDNAQFYSPTWQITDREYFATPGQLEALGKRLLECVDLDDESEIKAMAQWEHDRFIRWMLAHGWLPDSPQQAAAFYHAGNHRQQLFIARMHPCICGYDDLGALAAHLKKKCGMSKDFYKFDLSSIRSTPYILGMESDLWHEREKEEERDDH